MNAAALCHAVNNAAHMYPSSVPLIVYWNVLHANKQTSSVQYSTSLFPYDRCGNIRVYQSNLDEYTVVRSEKLYHCIGFKYEN